MLSAAKRLTTRPFASAQGDSAWRVAVLLPLLGLLLPAVALPSLAAQPSPVGPEAPQLASRGALALGAVRAEPAAVGRYEKLELTVELSATFDNPFDPEQVDVRAQFAAPSGRRTEVPGFWCRPYRPRGPAEQDPPLLEPDGDPVWKVRFAPVELGEHRFVVTARDRSGETQSAPGTFRVVPSPAHGFIRVSAGSPRYFQFDDGAPFFVIGQNLQNDWPSLRHSVLLADAGCNAARAWMLCHWSWLEWTFSPETMDWAPPGHWMRGYDGVAGHYNQHVAYIADRYLDWCAQSGVHLMVCLGAGDLNESDQYDSWGGNPYNAANGGFLGSPEQFWTDRRARQLYRRRLRYIVARWGHSRSVWAWELWNELGAATPEMVAWHQEMVRYLRQVDPNRHLVTTSTWEWNPDRFAPIWDLPEIDFTQSHTYQPQQALMARVAEYRARWPKPHIVGEGGGPPPTAPTEAGGGERPLDPEAVDLHDSLWAATMAGAAGATLPWWWRERIEPQNLFFHYAALGRFLREVPWTDPQLVPVRAEPAPTAEVAGPLSPVLIVPWGGGWGVQARRSRFPVGPDGELPEADELSPYLYGTGRGEWRNPPVLEVDLPRPGRLIVDVQEAAHAILEVRVDGEVRLHEESLNGPRTTVLRGFAVGIPAGHHEVSLDNVGSDWVLIADLVLTDCRDARRYPDVEVVGLQSAGAAWLWVHNRLHQWPLQAAGFEPAPVGPLAVSVRPLRDGPCRIEWWDTDRGVVSGAEEGTVRDGRLELQVPAVRTDLACRVRPS